MKVISTLREFQAVRQSFINKHGSSARIGFVPTMGFLHRGHISLVEQARANAELVVCSIFVNPLQFGPSEDLAKYPRDLARDCKMLEQAKTDIVFAPTVEEMYPTAAQVTAKVGGFDDVLEVCQVADSFQVDPT